MKKCVIIGSGLGGLSCGVILAKNGYEVTVLEQAPQIGGCLQCFRRDGSVFNTGMHYIGSADAGQTLGVLLHYLGVDADIRLQRLDPMGYDVVSLRGERFPLANGKEHFIRRLAVRFPHSRDELSAYYDTVSRVSLSSPFHTLNKDADLRAYLYYQERTVNEVVCSLVIDPLLREVLVGTQPLYAGVKDRTPFSTHALITESFNQSAFRIVGGSERVASSLTNTLKQMGGKVLTRHRATKIVCDDTHATAVLTANGEQFAADLVISAIHPQLTVGLVDSRLLRSTYRHRIEQARNTISPFTVYLKFRKNAVRYMNYNLYCYRGDSTWGCEDYDESSWPKGLLYMHFCHEENPEYAQTGEILTYMKYEDVKPWQGTSVGHRGESYEAFKQRKAEAAIQALEKEVPGISANIERYYTSTPLTYHDYTGVPEGSMYGIATDVNAPGFGKVSCKTRIPNLLLAGQDVSLHGMVGVLAGSLMTCSEVLTQDRLFAQILNPEPGT